MIQPGANGSRPELAIDQRCTQRRISMRPALQHRRPQPVAAARDTGGKEAYQLPTRTAGPDQPGADIAPEHGRSGERKGGFIEDIWLERARSERTPRLCVR